MEHGAHASIETFLNTNALPREEHAVECKLLVGAVSARVVSQPDTNLESKETAMGSLHHVGEGMPVGLAIGVNYSVWII